MDDFNEFREAIWMIVTQPIEAKNSSDDNP